MRYYVREANEDSLKEVNDEFKDILTSPIGVLCLLLSTLIGFLNSYIGGFIFISFIVSIIFFSRRFLVNPMDSFQPSQLGIKKAFLLAVVFSGAVLHMATTQPMISEEEILAQQYPHDTIEDSKKRLEIINNNVLYSDEEKKVLIEREALKEKVKGRKAFLDHSIGEMILLNTMSTFFLTILIVIGYAAHSFIFSLYFFKNQRIHESVALSGLFKLSYNTLTKKMKFNMIKKFLGIVFLYSFIVLATNFNFIPVFFTILFLCFLYSYCFYFVHIKSTDYDNYHLIEA